MRAPGGGRPRPPPPPADPGPLLPPARCPLPGARVGGMLARRRGWAPGSPSRTETGSPSETAFEMAGGAFERPPAAQPLAVQPPTGAQAWKARRWACQRACTTCSSQRGGTARATPAARRPTPTRCLWPEAAAQGRRSGSQWDKELALPWSARRWEFPMGLSKACHSDWSRGPPKETCLAPPMATHLAFPMGLSKARHSGTGTVARSASASAPPCLYSSPGTLRLREGSTFRP